MVNKMKQTKESFEKNVNSFLDYFYEFDTIANHQGYSTRESIHLFRIFMDHHNYTEAEK